jgi:hypothetical protein
VTAPDGIAHAVMAILEGAPPRNGLDASSLPVEPTADAQDPVPETAAGR